MRRRIDLHEISDATVRPHHYLNEYDGVLSLEDPPDALYDEALWQELVDARNRLRDVESRVCHALISEPLDAFEIDAGLKLWRMIAPGGVYNSAEFSSIEDALRRHAATLERR